MEKDANNKSCGNCRYYSQHYSKQKTKFDIVSCGHCMNQNNKDRNKKKWRPISLCEFWDNITVQKEERRRIIKGVLSRISESLENIAIVLQDDKDGDI